MTDQRDAYYLVQYITIRPYRTATSATGSQIIYTLSQKQISELCEPRDQKELGARHAQLADEVEAKSREQPLEAQRIAAVLA